MSPSAFALRRVERDGDSEFRWMYQSVFGFACLCVSVCVSVRVSAVFGYSWDTLLTRRSLVIAAAHALPAAEKMLHPEQVIITQKIRLITIIWTCVTERLSTERVSR